MAGDYMDEMMASFESVDGTIRGLVEVGALTEVGADKLRRKMASNSGDRRNEQAVGGPLPSPPFARSARDVQRRAPSGFVEDGSGAAFFTIAAGVGNTTTMRSKVSRTAMVDRLLVIPSGPGAVFASVQVGDEEQALARNAPVELYGESALTDTIPDDFSPIGPALDFVVVLENTTAVEITGTIGFKAQVKR